MLQSIARPRAADQELACWVKQMQLQAKQLLQKALVLGPQSGMFHTVTVLPMTSTQAGNLLQNAESFAGCSVTLHATFPDASESSRKRC